MAVSAIARQSEDKIMRQAYQRRKDEIFFHNVELEQATRRAITAEAENERFAAENERFAAENETLRERLAELEAK